MLGEPGCLGNPLDDLVQRLRQDREEEITELVLLDEFLVEGAELAARGQLPLLSPIPGIFIEHVDHRPLGIGDIDMIDAKLQHLGT